MRAILAALMVVLAPVVWATVPSETSTASYTCDGTTTAYAYPFKILASTDLVVTATTAAGSVTSLVLTADYSVSGVGVSTGGNVTLTAGSKCPNLSTLKIARTVPKTQTTSFRTQGSFNPAVHENALDKLTMETQQIDRDAGKLAGRVCGAGQILTSSDGVNLTCVNDSGSNPIADASTVTATGSTTARALRDRAADVVNVKDYGAKGDWNGTTGTDDTAALAAAFATGAGKQIVIPPGRYKSTAAITLTGGKTWVEGTRGASIIDFTGATDGIVFADDAGRDYRIEGLTLNTSSATAGKAIKLHAPTLAASAVTLSDITITVTGSGMWAYGLWGNNWQTSTVRAFLIKSAAQIGVHLENSSNALHFYNLEVVGQTFTNRALEVTTGSEVYVDGGTLQGPYAQSVVNVSASPVELAGIHFENTNLTPSDGADVIIGGTGGFVRLNGGSGASVTLGGTTCSLWMSNFGARDVVLGASTTVSMLIGNNVKSLTDNGGSNTNYLWMNRLNAGSMLPNKVPAYLVRPDAASIGAVTGTQASNDGTLVLANNARIYGIDAAGTMRNVLTLLDASDNSNISFKAGKQFTLTNTAAANKIFANDSLLYLYSPTFKTGVAGDGDGFKHKRVTTGSVGATSRADVTVTWGTAFADANYTPTCTVLDTSAAGTGLRVERVRTQAAASVIVQVMNDSAGALTGTLNCIAVHD